MIPISKNRPKVGDFQPHRRSFVFLTAMAPEVRRKALDFDANNLVSFAEPLGARWWEDTPRLSQQFSAFQQRRSKCAEVRSLGWQAHHWNSARSLGTAHAQLTTGVLRMVSWVPWGIPEMIWRYPHFRKPPVGWLWIPKLTAGNAPIKPYLCTYTSVLRLGIDIPDKREWRTCHSSSLKASSKIRFYLRSWNFLGKWAGKACQVGGPASHHLRQKRRRLQGSTRSEAQEICWNHCVCKCVQRIMRICNGSMGTRIENLFVSAHVSINNPFFETFASCLLMAKLHFPRQC